MKLQEQRQRLKKAALIYSSKLNWPVFPLVPNSKRPIIKGGFHKATTDYSLINRWWSKYPNANIGIPTGQVSGFWALDVDYRNGGDDSFSELIKQYGDLPNTVETITGGGGRHILFKYIEPVKKGILMDGIDIQGDGAYIVVAPSIHPNGSQYEWEVLSRPITNEIAQSPAWLTTLVIERKENSNTRLNDYSNLLQGVSKGNRNNSMMKFIGYLLAKKLQYKVAYEIVLLWNDKNEPPLQKDAVTRAFNNILMKENRKYGK